MTRREKLFASIPHWAIALLFVSSAAWAVWTASKIAPQTHLERPPNASFPIGSLPERPILQLELARTPADLEGVVQGGTPEARGRNIARMQEANRIDTLHFIPAYCLVLVALALLIARHSGKHGIAVFNYAAAAVLVIGVADLIENYGISSALDDLVAGRAPGSMDVAWIWIPAVVKWTLLGLLPIGLAGVAWLHRGWTRVLTPLLFVVSAFVLGPLYRHVVHRVWDAVVLVLAVLLSTGA